MKDEKIIARMPRNARQELVVRTAHYWNIDIIDVRWYENGNPTKKGIRINIDETDSFIRAIKKAQKTLQVSKNEDEQSEDRNEQPLGEEED